MPFKMSMGYFDRPNYSDKIILATFWKDLCKEEIYSNPSESERVNKEIKNLQDLIADLYENWEELSIEE